MPYMEGQVPIPKINIEEIALGNGEVYAGLELAVYQLGVPAVAFFLEMLPERGNDLYQRFLLWKKRNGSCVNWNPFILDVLSMNESRMFFPDGCHLSEITRGSILPLIRSQLGGLVVSEELVRIHFGEGEPYETVRRVSCRGCDAFECSHWLPKSGPIRSC